MPFPFVVLLRQDRADEVDYVLTAGKDAHDVRRRRIVWVSTDDSVDDPRHRIESMWGEELDSGF
ncbi:hypothetical protein [Humibacillus sp. DSM 29435]|uniref:hypothetical protein n=1 Tax=Humibacillus sp. DSM 29435 TaxID=1869167 RepID=UPI0011130D5D|nr:hypothetical protein [Humibacillus sp. DSM 29435]